MSVLGAVTFAADVNPIGSSIGGLFDTLIKIGIVDYPSHPFVEDLHIGVVIAV